MKGMTESTRVVYEQLDKERAKSAGEITDEIHQPQYGFGTVSGALVRLADRGLARRVPGGKNGRTKYLRV